MLNAFSNVGMGSTIYIHCDGKILEIRNVSNGPMAYLKVTKWVY